MMTNAIAALCIFRIVGADVDVAPIRSQDKVVRGHAVVEAHGHVAASIHSRVVRIGLLSCERETKDKEDNQEPDDDERLRLAVADFARFIKTK